MASLIACPHCGLRPREEFAIRGDASVVRPQPGAEQSAWFDYLHLRDNPKGLHREFWHHAGGCRRWLMVERDTLTHQVQRIMDPGSASTAGER